MVWGATLAHGPRFGPLNFGPRFGPLCSTGWSSEKVTHCPGFLGFCVFNQKSSSAVCFYSFHRKPSDLLIIDYEQRCSDP